MGAVGAALAFLLENLDIIEAVGKAIAGGASKEDLLKGIKATMVAASDAEMHRELDP